MLASRAATAGLGIVQQPAWPHSGGVAARGRRVVLVPVVVHSHTLPMRVEQAIAVGGTPATGEVRSCRPAGVWWGNHPPGVARHAGRRG